MKSLFLFALLVCVASGCDDKTSNRAAEQVQNTKAPMTRFEALVLSDMTAQPGRFQLQIDSGALILVDTVLGDIYIRQTNVWRKIDSPLRSEPQPSVFNK